ncbi:FGGY family carbohydrate kinase [Roseomonas sp. USHLN139]|uniref:FGGY family carbohydrate kinase n=1 Tax=Roseomonas sp. USHLN139 TaxID=3081298 RepID=UPI003B01D783
MSNGILALDQGTTSSRAYLWRDGALRLVGQHQHRQIRPAPGWVEHDAEEILGHLQALVEAAGRCAAAGLANQGETVIAWDAATGRPLHHAIVWQDERTAPRIAAMRAGGLEALTLARAGLPLDPYFAAGRMRWLLDHAEGARDLHRQGRLRLGTSDAFFLARLTGVAATDIATASRTSLMDIRTGAWDAELCAAFGVPMECLPAIRPSAGHFGTLANGTPVTASLVDQQAALYGHGCHRPGELKITFGTGAFALGLTEALPEAGQPDGLLPTLAWQVAGEAPRYALDGGILTAGAAVEWLGTLGLLEGGHAGLDHFEGPHAIERGLAFVPALAGLGCPHWDRAARGCFLGLGLETDKALLRRAVLEGIAFRAAELVRAFEARLGPAPRIAIDGGLSRSGGFTRFLAAVLGRPIEVAGSADMTALGMLRLCRADLPPPASRTVDAPPLPPALHERFARAVELSRGWAA